MRLSQDKINHLAHLITNGLHNDPYVKFLVDRNEIRKKIRDIILEEMKKEDEIDKLVRKRIASYQKKIPEGSQEWEVLYRKLFNEELDKRRVGK